MLAEDPNRVGRDEAEPAAPVRVLRGTLLTAVAQVTAMLVGGVLAIAITLRFGIGAGTDGVFAAYGVYGVTLLIAQSVRTTVVARLVEGESAFAQLDRFLGAGLVLGLACGIPFVVLGLPVASLLTGTLGPEASDTAARALVILWPAAVAQILAALFAAALATRGDFALPGLAYAIGGVTSIAVMLALAGQLGLDSVSLGVMAGSVLIAALMGGRLVHLGYRPSRGLLDVSGAGRAAWYMTVGALGFVVAQIAYIVSVAFAARLGEGAVTIYSYAFFAAALVLGATSGPVGIVLAAPIARTWDRRPESLEPHLLAVTRAALVLVVPVIGLAGIVGEPIVELVLGQSLGEDDPALLVATFLALSGALLSSCAAPVPTLAAFAASRYVAVLALAALTLAAHVGLSYGMLQLESLPALAAAASVSTLISLALVVLVVYGPAGALRTLWLLVREAARVLAVGAVAFLPAALGGWALGGGVWRLAAAVTGLVVFAWLVRAVLPEHRELVDRVVGPLVQRFRTNANMPQA